MFEMNIYFKLCFVDFGGDPKSHEGSPLNEGNGGMSETSQSPISRTFLSALDPSFVFLSILGHNFFICLI